MPFAGTEACATPNAAPLATLLLPPVEGLALGPWRQPTPRAEIVGAGETAFSTRFSMAGSKPGGYEALLPGLMPEAMGLGSPRGRGVPGWLPWLTVGVLDPMVRMRDAHGTTDAEPFWSAGLQHRFAQTLQWRGIQDFRDATELKLLTRAALKPRTPEDRRFFVSSRMERARPKSPSRAIYAPMPQGVCRNCDGVIANEERGRHEGVRVARVKGTRTIPLCSWHPA